LPKTRSQAGLTNGEPITSAAATSFRKTVSFFTFQGPQTGILIKHDS
jgi:hypothetical protein